MNQLCALHQRASLRVLLVVLVAAGIALCLLFVVPAQAAGLVTDCSNDAQFVQRLGGGGLVQFNCGTATITLGATQTVTRDTTIDGGNLISLSGGDVRRLFVVNNGVALTLTNVTIRDGNSGSNAGAILNNGTLTILGSRFYSNTTPSAFSGGAIESFGTMTIRNSEFAYNSAGNGGALFPRDGSSNTISGSNFHDNHATNTTNGFGGAALVWYTAQMTVTASSFTTNTATLGGALMEYFSGQLSIDHGTLSGNSAQWGGALYVTPTAVLTLTDSNLTANQAPQEGGAIANHGTATLGGVTLTGNSSPNGNGGALSNWSPFALSVTGSTFISNSAQTGGALWAIASLTVTGSSFTANSAAQTGGAVWTIASLTVNRSTFTANSATQTGGAIQNEMLLTLNDSTLRGNSAAKGGVLYNDYFATVNDSTLDGNWAGGEGGGIYNVGLGTLRLNNSALSSNHAGYGGGLYNDNGTAYVNTSTFSGNAAQSGGALTNFGAGTMTLEDDVVSSNAAEQFGGGIDNGGTLLVGDSLLSGNTVTTTGGALYNVGTATVNDSLISGNSAQIGGGITANIGKTNVNRSTLANNIASNGGGGIYSFGNVDFTQSTLVGNWAANGGGGYYNDHSVVTVTNSTLSGNATGTLGGGLYNSGQAVFVNVTLANNSATTGGALYVFGSAPTVLTNTILAYSPSGGNCAGNLTSSKFTLSSDNSCALPPGNTINGHNPNSLDPLLTALGNYGGPWKAAGRGPTLVHMLKLGSPAIAGILGNDAPTVDQRGQPRPGSDGDFDVGAVERQPSDSDLAPRLDLPLVVR